MRRKLNDAERRELHALVRGVLNGDPEVAASSLTVLSAWGLPRAVDTLGALCGAYLTVLYQAGVLGRGTEEDLLMLGEAARILPEQVRPTVAVLTHSILAALDYNQRGALGTLGSVPQLVVGLLVLLAVLSEITLGEGSRVPALSWTMSLVEPLA